MNSSDLSARLQSLVFDASQHESIIHPKGDFWLFAYGSLMWNPEFEFLRSETARLFGYHRRLCLWSVEYRGTVEQPGLVMGLDQGGSCVGRAFLVSEKKAPKIIAKLNQREMITGAYRSELKPLRLNTGEHVEAVCLIARKDHPQYAGSLVSQTILSHVGKASGQRGTNREYVLNTSRHLREMGIKAHALASLEAALIVQLEAQEN